MHKYISVVRSKYCVGFNTSEVGHRDTSTSWSVWERQCEGRGLNAAPWQCTCTRVTPYPWIFDEALDDCFPPAALLYKFGPSGLFLVPEVKILTKSRRFQRVEEMEENSIRDLRAIPQNTFQDAFQNWENRWARYIKSGGEYFEGDKFD